MSSKSLYWIKSALGLWLLIAPLTMQHPLTGEASLHAYVVGVVLVLDSTTRLFSMRIGNEWLILILGLWLMVSPSALGFGNYVITSTASWNQIIVGFLVCIMVVWEMILLGSEEKYKKREV